jgi:hypothetical protein
MVGWSAELKTDLVTTASRPCLETHPLSYFNNNQSWFSGENRSGCKAEHLISSKLDGEQEGYYTTSSPCDVMM